MPDSVVQTLRTQTSKKILSIRKSKSLGNDFVDSQFNCVPLIWMFCKKTIYFKMQKIHHKTLGVIYCQMSPTSLI